MNDDHQGYWFCPQCGEVPGEQVTFEEYHNACGSKVKEMLRTPPTTEQTELNKCLSLLKEILTDVGGVTNCSKIHNACVAFRNAGGAYKLSINPQERAIANDTSSEQTELWKEKVARIIFKHVKGSLNPIGIIGEDIAAKEIIETIEREYSLSKKQEVPEAVEFAEWIAQKHYYKDVHKEWYGCERGMTVLIAKTTAELFQLFKKQKP